jgi:HAD-superfamily hydrolase, subfamily IIB
MIEWNDRIKLIITDVDETIAPVYMRASDEMIEELSKLLEENKIIFFITGQSTKSIEWRIVSFIPANLRRNILIGQCSGCEVFGYGSSGKINNKPFYSHYEEVISNNQKEEWRKIIKIIIEKFKLTTYQTMPKPEFRKITSNPQEIMYEDRGPQITFEVVHGINLSGNDKERLNEEFKFNSNDFRDPIILEASKLLKEKGIPITPRKAGTFAIDFAVKDISKADAIKYVLDNPKILNDLGLSEINISEIEIWGDKFSVSNGGTDRHMSEALNPSVRSITFRKEDALDFLKGYNTVIWNGEKELEEGTLEFIKTRYK